MIDVHPKLLQHWQGQDPFQAVAALEGETFRAVKNRRTLRFELAGEGYFAKIHAGVGWSEILKNLLMLKQPILGARQEYEAIRKLEALDVATMSIVAFGERGTNPARRQSFVVTEELTGTESLEDFCRDWPRQPPPFALRLALIDYLAMVSRTLHTHGVNHRDFYLCHFLLDIGADREQVDPRTLKLYLIDLHRTQIRQRTPTRWIVKDLAGLYFSAMDIGLTRRDKLRFIHRYSGKSLRAALTEDRQLWQSVERVARKLYAKEARKGITQG